MLLTSVQHGGLGDADDNIDGLEGELGRGLFEFGLPLFVLL